MEVHTPAGSNISLVCEDPGGTSSNKQEHILHPAARNEVTMKIQELGRIFDNTDSAGEHEDGRQEKRNLPRRRGGQSLSLAFSDGKLLPLDVFL